MRRNTSVTRVGLVISLSVLLLTIISLSTPLVTAQSSITYDTGLVSPTSFTDVDSIWVNEGFAFIDDNLYAESAFRNDKLGRWHSYNPNIPNGATITGIEVRTDASGAVGVGWLEIQVFNGTIFSSGAAGTKIVPGFAQRLTTSKQTYIVGSPTDLWGLTWNASGANAIQVQVRVVNLNEVHRLWWIPVRIFYTLPSPSDTPTYTPTDSPTATDIPTEIPIPTIAPSPEPTARKVIVFLQGVCTEVAGGTDSGTGGFSALARLLRLNYGYSNNDFLLFSYTGGSMVNQDGTWVWNNNSYGQYDPIRLRLGTSADVLHLMLMNYRQRYPNTSFVLVGHSLGGAVAFEDVLQNVNSSNYQTGLISTVITIDSPIQGLPSDLLSVTTVIQQYACATNGEAYFDLVGKYYSTAYRNTLPLVVNQAAQRGVNIVTVGNNSDCVWSPTLCGLGIQGDTSVQYVFGSVGQVYEFDIEACMAPRPSCFIGRRTSHNVVLQNESALQTIARMVGVQN